MIHFGGTGTASVITKKRLVTPQRSTVNDLVIKLTPNTDTNVRRVCEQMFLRDYSCLSLSIECCDMTSQPVVITRQPPRNERHTDAFSTHSHTHSDDKIIHNASAMYTDKVCLLFRRFSASILASACRVPPPVCTMAPGRRRHRRSARGRPGPREAHTHANLSKVAAVQK